MKKLISIGVALALLTMAVVPGAVAAQPPSCDPMNNYTYPTTFAKIPFAIVQSGMEMIADIWPDLHDALGLTDLEWVGGVLGTVGGWAGGPLAWTVDMMGWGLGILAAVLDAIGPTLGLPDFLGELVNTIVCQIFTPFDCVVGDPFVPCPP